MGKVIRYEDTRTVLLFERTEACGKCPGSRVTLLLVFSLICLTWANLSHAGWIRIGPNVGNIRSLAIDPVNTKIVYAGTEHSGGVFKSVNGGKSWRNMQYDPGGCSSVGSEIGSLVIDPKNPKTLYAGSESGHLYKTTDSASTWSSVNSDLEYILSLAVNPVNTKIVFAGTQNSGVFKSVNGGKSWRKINRGMTSEAIYSLVIDPKNTNTLYTGTADGVFKSVDGGANWSEISSGLKYGIIRFLAIDPENTNTLYAAGPGVFKSVDGGANWSGINSELVVSDFRTLAIDPKNTKILYAGSHRGGVFKSRDGGKSWSEINSGLGTLKIRSLAIDPKDTQTLYLGTEGQGVFKSIDGGANWSETNSGLSAVDVQAFAINPGKSNTLYVGTNYYGLFKSVNAGRSWSPISSSPVGSLAIDPNNTKTLYSGRFGDGVYKSINGGKSWNQVNTGLPKAAIVRFLLIDRNDSRIVYAVTDFGIFNSANGGKRWKKITAKGSWDSNFPLHIDPLNTETLYVLDGGRLYKSTNRGASWSQTDPEQSISSLVVDPVNAGTLYAKSSDGLLVKSVNGGTSWSQVESSPTNFGGLLAIEPTNPEILYARSVYFGGCLSGVMKSSNGGVNWSQISSGLANPLVGSFVIDPENPQIIYVNGDGVYKRDNAKSPTPGIPTGPSPSNGATGIDASSLELSWMPTTDTAQYDVYLGTSTDPPLASSVTSPSYKPPSLSEEATYYWKVVAKNASSDATYGSIWSFSTCPLPDTPSNPSPAHGASKVGTTTKLTWTGSSDALSYEVYFGTTTDPPKVATVTDPVFSIWVLSPETTYYWKIIAKNNCIGTTDGPLWSFSTASGGSVIGTWKLVSINGQPANPADPLTYVVTETTATSQTLDCTEIGTYTLAGNVFTVTITNVSGSCGDSVGDQFSYTITIDGDTLTMFTDDEELGPATFVFTRVN